MALFADDENASIADQAEAASIWLKQHTTHGIGFQAYSMNSSKGRRWHWRWKGMDVPHSGSDEEFLEYCTLTRESTGN